MTTWTGGVWHGLGTKDLNARHERCCTATQAFDRGRLLLPGHSAGQEVRPEVVTAGGPLGGGGTSNPLIPGVCPGSRGLQGDSAPQICTCTRIHTALLHRQATGKTRTGGGGGNKYRERLPELLQGCVASLHHSIADPCVVLQQRLLVTSLREPLRACFRIGPDGGHDPLQAGDALLQQLQARGLLVVPKQTFLRLLLGVEPGHTLFIDL